jgi:hypothetical protein
MSVHTGVSLCEMVFHHEALRGGRRRNPPSSRTISAPRWQAAPRSYARNAIPPPGRLLAQRRFALARVRTAARDPGPRRGAPRWRVSPPGASNDGAATGADPGSSTVARHTMSNATRRPPIDTTTRLSAPGRASARAGAGKTMRLWFMLADCTSPPTLWWRIVRMHPAGRRAPELRPPPQSGSGSSDRRPRRNR